MAHSSSPTRLPERPLTAACEAGHSVVVHEEPHHEPLYAVRCVFRSQATSDVGEGRFYEERVTLWRAASFEQAVERAETEANEYGELVSAEYLGLAQVFQLGVDGHVGDGD